MRLASSRTGKASSVPRVHFPRWLPLLAAVACSRPHGAEPQPAPADPVSAARERLARFEAERRRSTDFLHLPPANQSHGADPYALSALDATHVVGVLRGASAVVVLDAELHEVARLSLPGSLVSVAVASSGEIWVAGELSSEITLRIAEGKTLTATITRESAETMALAEGAELTALIKAPHVILAVE